MINPADVEELEIKLLLSAVEEAYGYDFQNYAKSSLKRRINAFMTEYKVVSYLQLAETMLHNSALFEEFLKYLSITVSEMFRDPNFYKSLRENVLPQLETYPFFKIWCAGCATGEEVYSLAILLHEAGILDKAMIYATDFNNQALDIAKKGIYSVEHMKQYIKNYNSFGGKTSFSEYYTSKYNSIKMHNFLKKQITFANHNLVTDKSFGEMNLISCRNVMIYFDENLTNRVLQLFQESLCHHGFLCIGTKETLDFTVLSDDFDTVDKAMRIYQVK